MDPCVLLDNPICMDGPRIFDQLGVFRQNSSIDEYTCIGVGVGHFSRKLFCRIFTHTWYIVETETGEIWRGSFCNRTEKEPLGAGSWSLLIFTRNGDSGLGPISTYL